MINLDLIGTKDLRYSLNLNSDIPALEIGFGMGLGLGLVNNHVSDKEKRRTLIHSWPLLIIGKVRMRS